MESGDIDLGGLGVLADDLRGVRQAEVVEDWRGRFEGGVEEEARGELADLLVPLVKEPRLDRRDPVAALFAGHPVEEGLRAVVGHRRVLLLGGEPSEAQA